MGIERLRIIVEEIIQIREALVALRIVEKEGPPHFAELSIHIVTLDGARRHNSVMLDRVAQLHLADDTGWLVDIANGLRERLRALKREALECVADLLGEPH